VRGGSPKYDYDDALSDAWIGYTKAKEHDNLPPSIAGEIMECPICGHKMHMPVTMDEDKNADPSRDRSFNLQCESCNHEWVKEIKKTQFTTCVYHYIRGEIQRGARESRRCGIQKIKKQDMNGHKVDPSIISIDVFSQTSDNVCDALSVGQSVHVTGIGIEVKKNVHRAVSKLPPRQCEVISRMFGLEYNNEILEPMSQAQVADHIGISRQRICAIIKGSLARLHKELEKSYEA
jgi:DNA-directed RNA polymerase specialized sigma subunit